MWAGRAASAAGTNDADAAEATVVMAVHVPGLEGDGTQVVEDRLALLILDCVEAACGLKKQPHE
jgi:hypothetical protein